MRGKSLTLGFPVLQLVLHGHVLEGFLIGKSLTLGFPVLQMVLHGAFVREKSLILGFQ